MNKEEFLLTGLLEQYCLGLTSEEESKIVEDMFHKHPELKNQGKDIHQCMERYARANAIPPPDDLREKVIRRVAATDSSAPRKGIVLSGWSAIAIAAGFVGILAFGVINRNGKNAANEKLSTLSAKFENFQEACAKLEADKKMMTAQYAFLKDTKTTHIHLRGTANSPEALAVVYWNETKDHGYLKIVNLTPPPAGKTYQLWADIDNEMVDMGTFECHAEKMIPIPRLANTASLNVTLEKEGGSDHPDVSQLVMNGKV